MRLRLNAIVERVRASLFFLPMLAVIGAVAAGWAVLSIDDHLDQRTSDLPFGLVSTVDGARALLSTIAGATISFAGIAFSVSLLIIQQASSQYSPRVVHTLFRDPFNKRVMGLVVGTFTYCVIVLRSVRGPLEQGGDAVVPTVSVAMAVVLGIATILAVVAFIDHSAHAMDVSEILERVRIETTELVQKTWRTPEPGESPDAGPTGDGAAEIRLSQTGWIQQIDFAAMIGAIDEGATLRVSTAPGRYAIAGTVFATVNPAPAQPSVLSETLNAMVVTGPTRTMQQDASYGIRQLADVALKALSPGVNDPTTAQDAIFHTAAVLAEMLPLDPPQPVVTRCDGRRLVAEEQPAPADLVALAFDETRRAAADHPAVCTYLLEALHTLSEPIDSGPHPERVRPLRDQASRLLEGCRCAGLTPSDLQEVEEAYRKRFGDPATQLA